MKKLPIQSLLFMLILLVSNLFFINPCEGQTTYYSRSTGNWTSNTTWSLVSGGTSVSPGVFPVAGDIVHIEGSFNVTLPAGSNTACATLNITSSNLGNGTLTFNTGSLLVVSGNITVGKPGTSKVALISMTAGGKLQCGGNLFIGDDAACNITQGANSTVTVNGNATVLQPGVNNITNAWNVNAGTASVTGLFILDGVNATSTRKSNLVITTGTFNANGGIVVNGTTSLTKTINMTGASGVLNVGGSGILGASNTTFTCGSGTSVVNYITTGNQANIGNYTYFNLTISGSGTKTLLGNTTVNNSLKVLAGTQLSLSTFNITSASVILECGAIAGSVISGSGVLFLTGNLAVNDAPGPGTGAANIATPVALGGNRTFTIADDGSTAVDLLISAVISGSNTLTKAGAGTLELSANNTYTSTTIINAGILQYGTNNAIASGDVTVNGGTLDIKTFSDIIGVVTLTNGLITGTTGVLSGKSYTMQNGTVSAILAGNGNLIKNTTGTVSLTANNTYAGSSTIDAGTLSISSIANFSTASSLGTGSLIPAISIGAGGSLLYTGPGHTSNRSITVTANGAIINASGTGTLVLSGGISANNKNLILTGTGNATESGNIDIKKGTLTKTGTGTWLLGTANSYTGLTTVNAGILKFGSNNALSSGPVTINGGTLDIATFTDAVGILTLMNGSIIGTTGALSGTSFAMQQGTVSAKLSGNGDLTKSTTGTVTLAGLNTYTGVTAINAGILSVSIIGDGAVPGNLGAASNAAANLVLGGGTLQYTGSTASTNRNYTLIASTTSTVDLITNNLTITGASTNTTGNLVKTGAGTLILGGNNLHTGTTIVAAGLIKIAAAERISNAGSLDVNGTFDLGGFNETIGSFSGTGIVTSSASGNIIFSVGTTVNTVYAGVVQNGTATSLALTKNGTGTLTLSGNNSYSGKTTINAGAITLGASNVLPDNPVILAGGMLQTGKTIGFSETIGNLTVSSNSSISLGTGSHVLTIANSSAITWAATKLTINGWKGTGGLTNTATGGKIMVGQGGLTAAQLGKISFTGFNQGAVISATGELIPSETAFYSTGNVSPNILSNWKSARDGTGSSPADFTSGHIFIVQSNDTITTTANWTVSGLNSRIWIETGGMLIANHVISLSTTSFFQIEDSATYIHNNTGTPASTIFNGTEVFETKSNFIIKNWVNNNTSITSGVTLPYGNVEINWNAGGNWPQSLSGSFDLTAGNFSITSLGNSANEFRLTTASNGTALTLGIGGGLTVSAGILSFVGAGGNGSKACTVNVSGDVNITGTIDMNTANASSGAIVFNVNGNFTITGSGALKNSIGTGSRTLNFMNADGIQAFASTATGINSNAITFNVGTVSSLNTLLLQSNFIINNGSSLNILNNAALDCGTNIVQATIANTQGNFNLNSGATIFIGSISGISATGATGNIQTGTTRVFNTGANYIYNGLGAQSAGTGLTAAKNLEINNTAGVTLVVNASVSNKLILTSGNINCAVNTLSVTNNDPDAIIRTSGHVIGYLKRAIATGDHIYEFPVGTNAGFTPASLDLNSVIGAGSMTVRSTDGLGGNYPAPLSVTKRLNRDWTVTNNGLTGFTLHAGFSFLPEDVVGGGITADLKAYRANPGPAYTYALSDDYEISGNNISFYNLSALSNTAGFSEFGAGECNAGFRASFTKTMASACGGGSDGTITVTPTGGTAPYTYNWTGTVPGFSANTAALTGLASGDYTVVVSEVTGCTVTIPDITIWQAFPTFVTNNGGGSSRCIPTGYIILYGSGGVPPYTYSIDGTSYSASNTFNSLTAGTYTGYVKDLAGCVSIKPNIIVTGAADIVVTAFSRPASSCANNGSIELYLTGGMPPYTYSIDNVTYYGGNIFNSLAGATSYTGWVKDSKGCKGFLAGIVVGKALPVTLTATKINSSACSNSGYIELFPGGGVPGYTYSLTGSAGPYQASNKFAGLAVGTYHAWVQDSKGCKNVVFNINIGTDPATTINVTANTAITGSCNNSGTIQLFCSGGIGPFTYSIDNINYQSGNLFTGVAAGTYTGWVKDSRGCKGSKAAIVITSATIVTLGESHTSTSSCVNDGSIQLRPAGGMLPYTYSLNDINYQTTASFTGLAAGYYTAWVKDAKGCKASVNVTISQNPIFVTYYAAESGSCTTGNGSIQLFITGGTGPYTYSLDGNTYQSSNVFSGLYPGIYSGYVKDSKVCVGIVWSIFVGPVCEPAYSGLSNKNTKTITEDISAMDLWSMDVYPNPSIHEFKVSLKTNKKDLVYIMVADITGRKVLQSTFTGNKQFVFGKDLKPGLYYVQVKQGDLMRTIKVIRE